MAESQHPGSPLSALREDLGGEFAGLKLDQWCKDNGVQRQHTTRNTPQQNGVTEHANRDVGEALVCNLAHSGSQSCNWDTR